MLKKHVRYVHGYMEIMDDNDLRMPILITTAYERLIYELTNLNNDLISSEVKNDPAVLRCVEVVRYLIDETKSRYRELERRHEKREHEFELTVNDNDTVYSTELSYPSGSKYSLPSRNSVHSKHTSYHTSRSIRSTSHVSAHRYSKPVRSSHGYRSVENTERNTYQSYAIIK